MIVIHSQLLRCGTARGPDSWYNQDDPAKVGARKLLLFTESSLVVKKRTLG